MKNKQLNRNYLALKAILLSGFLFAAMNLTAQEATVTQEDAQPFCRHEFSAWGAGGLSTLSYSPTFGDRSAGFGGAFGLGYTFYFNRNFGILTGAELSFYKAKIRVDGLTDSYQTTDGSGLYSTDGADINYNTIIENYEEVQNLTTVNIPLMLQYQTDGENKFYAALGFKFGIPLSGGFKTSSSAEITASGEYYNTLNQELFDQRDLGYGIFDGRSVDDDIDFKFAIMGAAEAGVKWTLNSALSLYTGLYFEYGFNKIVDAHNNKFVEYNHVDPRSYIQNSALTSEYTQDGETRSFVDRVNPMAVGLKIRLGFNACRTKGEPAPVQPEEVLQTRIVQSRNVVTARVEEDEYVVEPVKIEAVVEDLKKAVSVFAEEYGEDVKEVISIQLVGYAVNQTALPREMTQVLDEAIEKIMRVHGEDVIIICEGHTCNVGKVDYNIKLGLKRAEVVRDYLVQKGGFKKERVSATSQGPNRPVAPNDTEENRKENRRVVLIIK